MAKENNKDRILKLLKECKNHQTAESIAVQLNIQRNTASGILNELVREGIVQKEKTRPVIFSYIQPEDQLPEDPFTTFIGADQSLKDAVELILKHEDLQNIMDTIIEHHVTKKSFVPSKQKPKAILLCCTTGLG